jgi:phospholipid-binding lipoprotein MlaA
MIHLSNSARGLAAAAAVLALSGCATTSNPQDPLEGYNRAVFSFNDAVDRTVLKPTATAYKNVTPSFVQTGVSNFFGNLSDAWSAVNNLLQGKGQAGMGDVTRVAVNSTFGIFGLLDIASEAGIPKHNEDFGQTLGVWGVPSGPYLMLPLLGPSTVRDTAALPADIGGDIWKYKEPANWRNIGAGVRVIDKRASLLDASSLLEDAALDRYEFIRDGYLQRRQSQVYDGDPPPSADAGAAEEVKEGANSQVVPQPVSSEKQ